MNAYYLGLEEHRKDAVKASAYCVTKYTTMAKADVVVVAHSGLTPCIRETINKARAERKLCYVYQISEGEPHGTQRTNV